MQALILAAGRGSRLGTKSGGVSKCLLEIDREPLIEHQIRALSEAGIGPVGMVVGFAGTEVQEIVGIKSEYIQNPRWKVTNSLYSFWLARDWVDEDLVVLNCDILFDSRFLDRLLAADGNAILYDSSSGDAREQMSVKAIDGQLKDMRKDMPSGEVSGENVGILKFTKETAKLLFERAGYLIEEGREKEWLGSAVRLLAQQQDIQAIDIAGLPWAEIDFPYDLEKARKVTWPEIKQAQRKSPKIMRRFRWAAMAMILLLASHSAYSMWIKPTEIAWDSVYVSGATEMQLRSKSYTRIWSMLEENQTAVSRVVGPAAVRFDLRPLFRNTSEEDARYVIELEVDGQDRTWMTREGKLSQTWNHPEWGVGKRDRIEIDLPAGVHDVRLKLIASEQGPCLVRVRQVMIDLAE